MEKENENPLGSIKEFADNYKQVEKEYAGLDNIADIQIETKRNKEELANQHDDFVRLVRKVIDLDNPKRNFTRQIEETKKEIEILKSGYKVKDNDPQLLELNNKLADLEESLAGIVAEELLVQVDLDPLNDNKRKLDIEAQVLEDKGSNLLKKPDLQN